MDNQYQTLSEATTGLTDEGYTINFKLRPDRIVCPREELEFGPNDFHIDEFHRFEGMSDPADMAIIYAITTKDGRKGVLIDAYGTYSDSLTDEMLRKIRIH